MGKWTPFAFLIASALLWGDGNSKSHINHTYHDQRNSPIHVKELTNIHVSSFTISYNNAHVTTLQKHNNLKKNSLNKQCDHASFTKDRSHCNTPLFVIHMTIIKSFIKMMVIPHETSFHELNFCIPFLPRNLCTRR